MAEIIYILTNEAMDGLVKIGRTTTSVEQRIKELENLALAYNGVEKAYAIQAGRELRVLINAHTVPDHEMAKIARDIARRIEDQVAYPGEVRVTLIRETRQTAVAR